MQNTPSAVKVLRLSRNYTTAAVLGTIIDLSSQFNTLGSPAAVSGTVPPTLPFWVSEVAAGSR